MNPANDNLDPYRYMAQARPVAVGVAGDLLSAVLTRGGIGEGFCSATLSLARMSPPIIKWQGEGRADDRKEGGEV